MDSLPKLKSGELEIALSFDPNDVAVAERRLDRARAPARRPALPRARPRPPARQQAQPPPRRPRVRRLDRGHPELRLLGDDCGAPASARASSPRIAFESDDYARDPGLRGRRRRRRADRRARAHHRARRHRDPLARPRDADAPHPCRRARRRLPLAGHHRDARDPHRRGGQLPHAPPRSRSSSPADRVAGRAARGLRDLRLHGDVGAGRAHRLDQPRPGLPRRGRPASRCSTPPCAALHAGANQYAPLPGVPALRAGDRRAPAQPLRPRARSRHERCR